jgi:uncharacterized protein YbjT (DUF2867 family)
VRLDDAHEQRGIVEVDLCIHGNNRFPIRILVRSNAGAYNAAMTIFIAGITGHVGGAAASRLLAQGHAIRALVRDPSKAEDWVRRGVDVRAGDFTDASSVAAALAGVEAAFVMLPPMTAPARGYPEARAMIASLCEALRRAPVPRLVALSSVGADRASGTGLILVTHYLEQALHELGTPLTSVRASSFLENYAYALPIAAATGTFDTFLTPTDRSVAMVASADIGAEVARRLVASSTGIVELGSRYSPDDLARAMAEVIGRPVTARTIPRERWASILEAQGFPRGGTWAFEEMEDGVNSGWIDFGVAGAEAVPATITPAAFFRGSASP